MKASAQVTTDRWISAPSHFHLGKTPGRTEESETRPNTLNNTPVYSCEVQEEAKNTAEPGQSVSFESRLEPTHTLRHTHTHLGPLCQNKVYTLRLVGLSPPAAQTRSLVLQSLASQGPKRETRLVLVPLGTSQNQNQTHSHECVRVLFRSGFICSLELRVR